MALETLPFFVCYRAKKVKKKERKKKTIKKE
jgi:hypothetical protein